MTTETIKDGLKNKISNLNPERKEGPVARAIESQTARIPSDVFLWGAGGAALASLTLKFLKREHESLLAGQWVAPLLLLGVYNKLVKQLGHDQDEPVPSNV